MKSISRKITVLAVTGALVFPVTIMNANAQSSFGSSSLNLESLVSDPKSSQLERAIEEVYRNHGIEFSLIAEAQAEEILNRAKNGEIPFGSKNFYEGGSTYYASVSRVTEEEVDRMLANAPASIIAPSSSERGYFWGIAVGKADGYYYLARSISPKR